MNDHLLISVITPCFNAESYIEEAIESVREQDHESVEHIVVDGGSSDSTVDILEQYPEINYISEPDDGIYDALNKGLELATGDLIGWLNADDKYAKGAFDSFATAYRDNTSCDLIAGDCSSFIEENGSEQQIERRRFSDPAAFNDGVITHNVLLNGCMFTPDLIDSIGTFDGQLQIGGDREYLIRIAATRPHLVRLDTLVYRYRIHEGSITFLPGGDRLEAWKEINEDSMEYLPKYLSDGTIPAPLDDYCRSIFRYRSGALLRYYVLNRDFNNAIRILRTILRNDWGWFRWAFGLLITRPSVLRNA